MGNAPLDASTTRGLSLLEVLRYPGYTRGTLASIASQEFLPARACTHRNFYYLTRSDSKPAAPVRLERGIWPVEGVTASDGVLRRPAVLLRTSGHKAGAAETPWHDHLDQAVGVANYYGDKRPGDGLTRPDEPLGNRVLLAQADLHRSPERGDRLRAAPLLFFSSQGAEGSQKGHVRFEGLGVIERVELVSQTDRFATPFSNYRFDCGLVSLAAEGERLDWRWIDARRNDSIDLATTARLAPTAWRAWIDEGASALTRVRRRLARGKALSDREQLPEPGTPEHVVLHEVVAFYQTRRERFEALAARVMEERLGSSGVYHRGWLTRRSGDGGVDMVARLDIGQGAEPVRLIVLGQAKCTDIRSRPLRGVSGSQLARLVARLRRGWFGVFVTTGFVTADAQVELLADEYPVMLICGRQVAETVRRLAILEAGGSVRSFLERIDTTYEGSVSDVGPERVLDL